MQIDYIGSLPLIVIWLALGAIGIVIQAFVRDNTRLVFGYYVATLGLTGLAAIVLSGHKGASFGGMITLGGYANYFDALFCGAGIMALLAARPYLQKEESEVDEFYTMLVSSVAGMMLMAHASNLVVLFVGIELMSISFYVMAGFFRTSTKSVEAALKYFLLGCFATGFLVYGMSLIYGGTGSLAYGDIARTVVTQQLTYPTLFVVGTTLLVIGLSFKIAAFPFHQWAPDVYEGAPTAVTAFMSTAGKAAAFSAFVAVFVALLPAGWTSEIAQNQQIVIAVIAAATMLLGNITAVVQSNVKRMLAYSSVAHAGYMLMGILAGPSLGTDGMNGHHAIVFYATSYLFMQMGAFVVVGILERRDGGFLNIDDYAGLHHRHPVLAALMAVFMFSLAGIPPFAGFFGKYMLFAAAIERGFTWLAIVGVVSSVISAWFYLGLIVKMYFQDAKDSGHEAPAGLAGFTLAVSVVGVVFFGLFPQLLINIFRSW
ncbi:MAG TPA: NADH-quinone oxidoreductase subunit N [Bacteroidetes bacterium]|nr:NADH-quinone oxidoreductase subunit N [Bacteroidota bacterium]HRK03645.1 NADH-quinone oxidoreductase subunit N [Chlorobiota bacterium]